MIAVRHVTKRFGDFTALDDVSLEVPDGSLTALLGPSGSGKSTLLRIIAGLEAPDCGSVDIHGADATRVPPQQRGIGFVFQHYAAFKHMTVRDNVAFGLKIRKQPKAEITRASTSCSRRRPRRLPRALPGQLSGGQRQRMALARALAVEPRVLLLDEPFGALDAKVRAELREWLRRLHDEVHVTTVLVTHDQEEAMEVADRIAVLNDGRIEQVGAPARALRPAGERVRDGLPRPGQPGRRRALVRPHDLALSTGRRTARARRWSSASCTSASRARRRRLGPDHPAARPRRWSSSTAPSSGSGRPVGPRCPPRTSPAPAPPRSARSSAPRRGSSPRERLVDVLVDGLGDLRIDRRDRPGQRVLHGRLPARPRTAGPSAPPRPRRPP